MKVHIVDAPFNADTPDQNNRIWSWVIYQPGTRTLCGHLVIKPRTKRSMTVNLPTVSIDCPTIRQRSRKPSLPKLITTAPLRVPNNARHRLCLDCLHLARMTPDARARMIEERETKKDVALLRLRARGIEAKAKALAEIQELIERARPDAQVCLDALLEGGEALLRLQRCILFVVTERDNAGQAIAKSRCKLTRWHTGEHVACKPDEAQPIDYAEVLERAVEAHKLEHKSGGSRLWISDTNRHVYSDQRPKFCDVVCRFCRQVLGERMALGIDYTSYAFPSSNGTINVQRHTELCALRYLAGLPAMTDESARVDDIVGFKEPLPAESFVLEHDQEAL